MSRTRFREILVQSAHLTRQEVINKLQAKDTPALELAVLAVLREAIVRGDPSRLEVILNRMIGRVPTHIFLDDEEDRPYDAESDDDILAAARGEE